MSLCWVLRPRVGAAGSQAPSQPPVTVVPTILGAGEDRADEEVTVTINNPISLICEALAFPSPTITWMKDGSPFEASNNIQLLPGEARCREECGVRGRDW